MFDKPVQLDDKHFSVPEISYSDDMELDTIMNLVKVIESDICSLKQVYEQQKK